MVGLLPAFSGLARSRCGRLFCCFVLVSRTALGSLRLRRHLRTGVQAHLEYHPSEPVRLAAYYADCVKKSGKRYWAHQTNTRIILWDFRISGSAFHLKAECLFVSIHFYQSLLFIQSSFASNVAAHFLRTLQIQGEYFTPKPWTVGVIPPAVLYSPIYAENEQERTLVWLAMGVSPCFLISPFGSICPAAVVKSRWTQFWRLMSCVSSLKSSREKFAVRTPSE